MSNASQFKFSDLAPEQSILELHVGTCSKPPKHFNIYDETRGDFFSIGLLIEGQVKIKLNLKEKHVAKNSILFLAPNTLKQIVSRSEDVKVYSVVFTSKFLLQIGIEQHEIELFDFNSRNNENSISLTDEELNKIKKTIEDLKDKNDQIQAHPQDSQTQIIEELPELDPDSLE